MTAKNEPTMLKLDHNAIREKIAVWFPRGDVADDSQPYKWLRGHARELAELIVDLYGDARPQETLEAVSLIHQVVLKANGTCTHAKQENING